MVAEARARLSLDGKPFSDTLKKVGDEVDQDFGTRVTNSFKAIGASIAAAFTLNAVKNFVSDALKAADEIDNLSKRLGVGRETVQSLGQVAKESGLSMADFEGAILRTTRAATEAESGNSKLRDAFGKLGISVKDLKDLNPEQVFESVAKAMANNQGNAEVLSAAYDVIGTRAGPKLTSELIKLGEEGFGALNERMLEFGRILDDDTTQKLDAAELKISVFTTQVKNKFVELAAAAIDVFNEDAANNWIGSISTATDDLSIIERKLLEFADTIKDRQGAIVDVLNDQIDAKKSLEKATENLAKEQAKNFSLEERIESKKLDVVTAQNLITDAVYRQQEAEVLVMAQNRDLEKIKKDIQREQDIITQKEKDAQDAIAEQLRLKKELADPNWKRLPSEIADLEKKIEDAVVNQVKAERDRDFAKQAVAKLTVDQLDAEKEIANQNLVSLQAQKDQVDAQTKLLTDERELTGLLKNSADHRERSAKESKTLLTTEEEIAKIKDNLHNLENLGLENTREYLDLQGKLKKLVGDTADATEQKTDKERTSKDLSSQQLDLLERFRDMMRGMTDKELEDLITGMKKLADELSKLPEVKSLSWLTDLNELKFRGLTSGQAEQMVNSLKVLINGLNGLPTVSDNLLDFLGDLGNLQFKGLTTSQAGRMVSAIETLINGLKPLGEVDISNVTALMAAIGGATPGKYEIAISLPEDFGGIPLVFDDSTKSTMESIDKSLNELAQMKGVIWA